MSCKPRYRVIVARNLPVPYSDDERELFETSVEDNLNELNEEGYRIIAVAPIDGGLVYTLERKP
jgi:hypothetical protein